MQEPRSPGGSLLDTQTGLKRISGEDSSGVPLAGRGHHFCGLHMTAAPPQSKAPDTLCSDLEQLGLSLLLTNTALRAAESTTCQGPKNLSPLGAKHGALQIPQRRLEQRAGRMCAPWLPGEGQEESPDQGAGSRGFFLEGAGGIGLNLLVLLVISRSCPKKWPHFRDCRRRAPEGARTRVEHGRPDTPV